ncbi:MAG TPA: nitrilase-related carbon-nitrogen hydrolase [Verrucomicrobiae bacterium]|nr:nitrilase-related carbon-nitrogen hydrolase [Verrucomicrobiae bacterium]
MMTITPKMKEQEIQAAGNSSSSPPARGHSCPQQLTDGSDAPARADVAAGWKAGLPLWQVFLIGLAGAGCLHLAYAFPRLSLLLLGTFVSFAALSLARSRRKAFYPVLLIGLAVYAPQLGFFWTIFGGAAVLLWLVLALWLALFSVIAWRIRTRWGVRAWLVALPFLWTGIEYFRSELYFLRFSWINAAYALAPLPTVSWLVSGGVYAVSFLLMSMVSLCLFMKWKGDMRVAQSGAGATGMSPFRRWLPRFLPSLVCVFALALITNVPETSLTIDRVGVRPLKVAGIQSEFPQADQVPGLLDKALAAHPDAELFVLSEYTFDGPVTTNVLNWCRMNGKHLIVGGKDPVGDDFYNTAFVVGPAGEIIFKQVKAVPIQFFADGLPAPEQKVWDSPWGKLGILTCYDLSYTRVVDELVRQGAQALINPTMDMMEWGEYQHELHSRVPPVRAAEHGIPLFRVASSGVSQLIDRHGRVTASAPFARDEAVIGGELMLGPAGRLPLDRWLAPLCVGLSGVVVLVSFLPSRRRSFLDS